MTLKVSILFRDPILLLFGPMMFASTGTPNLTVNLRKKNLQLLTVVFTVSF
jgi:hypothetical protein